MKYIRGNYEVVILEMIQSLRIIMGQSFLKVVVKLEGLFMFLEKLKDLVVLFRQYFIFIGRFGQLFRGFIFLYIYSRKNVFFYHNLYIIEFQILGQQDGQKNLYFMNNRNDYCFMCYLRVVMFILLFLCLVLSKDLWVFILFLRMIV